MATATVALPGARRRPRAQRVGGRARLAEVYFTKPIDNSRVRRERDPKRRGDCYGLLGLLALIFSFMFFYAWQHFQCVRCGYQIEQLRRERGSLEEQNRQLRLEKAGLEDPERIDALANQRWGFVPRDPRQVIQLGTVTDTSPAASLPPEVARNVVSPMPAREGTAGEP